MKKKLLFLVCVLGTLAATGQNLDNRQNAYVQDEQKTNADPQAKGTAVAFYSEHFDTGIPVGWTSGIFAGPNATWKWYAQGQVSPAANALAAINTTTGSMIYDADSIGAQNQALTPSGWLRSASISCAGHSTVAVKFAEYFRRLDDSCFVDVSTNNFATYTRFPVMPNNMLNPHYAVAYNPYQAMVNISSAAANQANVQIRFSYYGAPGGSYSWQIDDMTLSELDATNVGIHNSFLFSAGVGAYNSSVSELSPEFTRSFQPVTKVDNLGYNAQGGFTVTAKIYQGNTQVYSQTQTVASLPVGAADTLVYLPSYTPTSIGNYTVAYSLSVPGNINVYNVADTVKFRMTDSMWSHFGEDAPGIYYVHRPISMGEMSQSAGSRFDVPAAVADTIISVWVCFGGETTVGTTVQVQLYKLDNIPANGWIPTYKTFLYTLTASDISMAQVLFARLPIDNTSGPAILDQGTWAAVVTSVNAPASSTVTVRYSSPSPATGYAGSFGQLDTSLNNGSFAFGVGTPATGVNQIPYVRLVSGPYVPPTTLSVWPGDVNYDHIVDNNDALDLTLGYGNTGAIRPSATNIYTPQPCTDWGTFIVPTVDMKNADCNGDGIVDYLDTVAIVANYGLTHPKGVHTAQPKATGLPDLYFDIASVNFIAGSTVHVPIKFGTAGQPMNNIMGLAALIKVNGITLAGAPGVSINTSWMGTAANLLNFKKGVTNNQTDWAFGRIDHTNVSGEGTIATLDMNIPTNAGGQIMFYFDNVRVIDNAGNEITGYNVIDDTATIIPASIYGVQGPVQQVAIIPNPSSSKSVLQMYLDAPAKLHITVSDIVGKTVYEMSKDGSQGMQHVELPATELAPGVYTVKLSSESWQGTETLKWIRN